MISSASELRLNVYSEIIRNNVAAFLPHNGIHLRMHIPLQFIFTSWWKRQVKIRLPKLRITIYSDFNACGIVNVH